jgi:A/G-specific adenine glycosylase
MRSNPRTIKKFRTLVWNHYRREGRHALPWRIFPRSLPAGRRAYRIVVSEIMLQQTQVTRVLAFYPVFLKRFPSFRVLAKTPRREVLKYWQGLGYNRRAVALHRLATEIMTRHGGTLPRDPEALMKLPGLGRATAGSVAAFAFNLPVPFVETNIRRVFLHHFFPRAKKVREEKILALVEQALPAARAREWYSALMDYGAWLAKRTENPNRRHARYRRQPAFAGSSRELRGKLVKHLLSHPRAQAASLARIFSEPLPRVKKILAALTKEGLAT